MTTAPPNPGTPPGPGSATPRRGPSVLVPLGAALVVAAAAVGSGALLGGSSAAAGAAIGAALVCGFFGSGALVLGVVARLVPAASLLVALLTYTLQVVLLAVVFLALQRGGMLDGPVDARWLSGTVIAGTLMWLAAQLVAFTRTRQPVYDLPSRGTEASAR